MISPDAAVCLCVHEVRNLKRPLVDEVSPDFDYKAMDKICLMLIPGTAESCLHRTCGDSEEARIWSSP